MKPILFNTEMVEAILDGRKMVTRRVIKEKSKNAFGFTIVSRNDGNGNYIFQDVYDTDENDRMFESPQDRIKVGDILYVKETWQQVFDPEVHDNVPISQIIGNWDLVSKTTPKYQPQSNKMAYIVYKADNLQFINSSYGKLRWRSPVTMPKEAARIFLKVIDVRIERLQQISWEQCEKEGIIIDGMDFPYEAVYEFSLLWNSTVKKSELDRYGWDANPWVYVIEFERCEKE